MQQFIVDAPSAGKLLLTADFQPGIIVIPPVDPPPVEPPPIVIPPPSGVYSNPDVIENMYEVRPGEWLSRDIFRSSVAALQFRGPQLRPGSRVISKFARKANYKLDGNIKVWRCWPQPGPKGYPNIYGGTQSDGGFIFNTEQVEGMKNVVKFYFPYPQHSGDWRTEIWDVRYASAPGKADGAITVTIGGKVILDAKGWQSNTAALPLLPNIVCIQDDISNGTLPVGSFTSYKDIDNRFEI